MGFWEAFFASDAIMVIAIGLVLGAADRIFELIIELRDWFNPLVIIDEYEQAVVLRFGKYNRMIGPGLHWIWPCSIEAVMEDTVVRTTSYLDVQTLTTKDGHQVHSGPIIIYKIGNIRRWLLEVDDAETALHDVTYGLNEELMSETDLEDYYNPEYARTLTDMVRREGITWGARVEAVKFSDKVKSKSLRLWMGD